MGDRKKNESWQEKVRDVEAWGEKTWQQENTYGTYHIYYRQYIHLQIR